MMKRFGVFICVMIALSGCGISKKPYGNPPRAKQDNIRKINLIIGNYLDKKEDELRMHLQHTDVTVARFDNCIILILPSHIAFTSNGVDIDKNIKPVLTSTAVILSQFKYASIKVDGHTDSIGTLESNKSLSQKQADILMNYLIQQGVNPKIISSNGLAYKYPMDTNDTEEGRQRNRRVEIKITSYPIHR
ncbi:MAG: OmpA family protein [Candidatus Liberibacter ctenarytainae]|uniref:OmpA family protein n=1 Tax=Candidatus Liberibacter ctenarytainae TaxID=2020335 RepID=A0A937DH46_9HYPH|nr:OmpA family protein [Candidatus Liberibacter ctenarytainae]